MSAHTPGPWVVERCYLGSSTVAQMRSPDRLVCINAAGGADAEPPGFKATDANARLIAAAPDLLHAARVAEALISDSATPETEAEAEEFMARAKLTVDLLLAAIAKAEGR